MRILLGSAHPYLPQLSGGAQSSTHELAVELKKLGHEVCVLSGLTGAGWLGFRSRVRLKILREGYVRDDLLGYPVFRAWFAWDAVARVVADFAPDVAVFQSGFPVKLAQAAASLPLRRVIYLHNVELDDLGGDPAELGVMHYIANSGFTARRFADLYGLDPVVIHPMVLGENYTTPTTRQNVTFINPHPHKGVDVAFGVAAACPEIPFAFVKTWTLSPGDDAALERRAAALGNVTLRPVTRNMKSVYGAARIVLAPSQWEEAFGRIATEAHFSGIPVVGSRCGGLPEAIGPGGILVDRDAPIDEWAAAVRRLWHDEAFYRATSDAALAYAARPDMNRHHQMQKIMAVLEPRTEGAN